MQQRPVGLSRAPFVFRRVVLFALFLHAFFFFILFDCALDDACPDQ